MKLRAQCVQVHAGQSAAPIGHLLAAVVGRKVVLRATHAVADFPVLIWSAAEADIAPNIIAITAIPKVFIDSPLLICVAKRCKDNPLISGGRGFFKPEPLHFDLHASRPKVARFFKPLYDP